MREVLYIYRMNKTTSRLKKMITLAGQAQKEAQQGARIEMYYMSVHHSVAGITDVDMELVPKEVAMHSKAHFSLFGAIVAMRDIMSRMSIGDDVQEKVVAMITDSTKGLSGPNNEDGRVHEQAQ
jgi:hypothetical protein